MNQEEKLQRLLRLKRHEKPAEDYFEDFVAEFHRRQRAGGSSAVSRPGLWERIKNGVAAVLENVSRPAVGWGAVAACGVVLMVFSQRLLSPDEGAAPVAIFPNTPQAVQPSVSSPLPAAETRVVNEGAPLLPTPPPGKARTKDQIRDVKNLIGPPLPQDSGE